MRGKHADRATIGGIIFTVFALLGILIAILAIFVVLMLGLVWASLQFVH